MRLVNSGFGSGEPWDNQFDAMTEGWGLFLLNLQLHLAHFAGQPAAAMLPTAIWAGNSAQTWNALIGALGLPASPAIGDRIAASAPDAPPFAGTVVNVGRKSMAILIEEPCPGTGIIAAEPIGSSALSTICCIVE